MKNESNLLTALDYTYKTRKQLMQESNITNEINFRYAINELRKQGYPVVCKGKQGYKLTKDIVEIDNNINSLSKRCEKIIMAIQGLQNAKNVLIRQQKEREYERGY